jgi:hypothetical protein
MPWTNAVDANQTGVQTINDGVWTGSTFSQYTTLVGGATNSIVGITPSATIGIPLVSGGSSANPNYTTIVVAGGGTGATSFTAYAPILGGTTATGSVQSAGTDIGTAGHVLTSNGSSAIPSFQAAVSSVAGTANQVLVNGSSGSVQTGSITLTLPQNISISSVVQFSKLGLGTTTSNNTLSITGNASIGYGDTAAPTSGLIVQGASGFGTSSISNFFNVSPSSLSTYNNVVNISGTLVGTNTNNPKLGLYVGPDFNPIYSGAIGTVTSLMITPSFAPGASCTITIASGCYIQSGSSSGAGTIGQSFGLFVNVPGFGTNKYTAYFDQYVGIGTQTPMDPLHIAGNGSALTVSYDTPGTGSRGRFFCLEGGGTYLDSSIRFQPLIIRTTDSGGGVRNNFIIDYLGNVTLQRVNTNVLSIWNSTTTGALTATMTNSPKTGNPAGWIQITVNGSANRYIPYW